MTIFLIILISICFFIYKNKKYKEGTYYQVTRNSYFSIKRDKGQYLEYLTYLSLRHFENNHGKFLFNVLIPKGNNERTEIDVILICTKGLFVFECKNYGGWIFGSENHQNWTQTLPMGRGRSNKKYFYNPIMQNAGHIKYLKNLIGENVPMKSVIVFSDRCRLKNITIKNYDVHVINYYKISSAVAQVCAQTGADVYTESEVNDIYQKLYPYTQFDSVVKNQHIKRLKKIL